MREERISKISNMPIKVHTMKESSESEVESEKSTEIIPCRLQVPDSVKTVICRLEESQLTRAKEDMRAQLDDIMLQVNRIINRYQGDIELNAFRKKRESSLIEKDFKKCRISTMEQIHQNMQSADVKERILTELLVWFEDWHTILTEVTKSEESQTDYYKWIAAMEALSSNLSAAELNVNSLIAFSIYFLKDKKRRKKRLASKGTMWKTWREKVLRKPAAGTPLKPEQMIKEETLTNNKVSEILGMLQELINSNMFNKGEVNAIKYISSTTANLHKALGFQNQEMKNLIFQCTTMGSEIKEYYGLEKQTFERTVQILSDKNEALEKELQNQEEKYMELLQAKANLEHQLSLANAGVSLPSEETIRKRRNMLLRIQEKIRQQFEESVSSPESSQLDLPSATEYLEVPKTEPSGRRLARGTSIKWDLSQTKVDSSSDSKPGSLTISSTSPGKPPLKSSKDTPEDHSRASSPEGMSPTTIPVDRTRQQISKEKMRGSTETVTESKSQESRGEYGLLTDSSKIGRRQEQLLEPSERKRFKEDEVGSVTKLSELQAERKKQKESPGTAEGVLRTGESPSFEQVEDVGGKPDQAAKQKTTKKGKGKKEKTVPEAYQSDDRQALQDYQKAIMSFLQQKIDGLGKADSKSEFKEQIQLKNLEAQKSLKTVREKMEEYFQKMVEILTNTLKKHREKKEKPGEAAKPAKKGSLLPPHSFSEKMDPMLSNILKTLLPQADTAKEEAGEKAGRARRERKEGAEDKTDTEEQSFPKNQGMQFIKQLQEERRLWKETQEQIQRKLQEENAWFKRQDEKRRWELKQRQWQAEEELWLEMQKQWWEQEREHEEKQKRWAMEAAQHKALDPQELERWKEQIAQKYQEQVELQLQELRRQEEELRRLHPEKFEEWRRAKHQKEQEQQAQKQSQASGPQAQDTLAGQSLTALAPGRELPPKMMTPGAQEAVAPGLDQSGLRGAYLPGQEVPMKPTLLGPQPGAVPGERPVVTAVSQESPISGGPPDSRESPVLRRLPTPRETTTSGYPTTSGETPISGPYLVPGETPTLPAPAAPGEVTRGWSSAAFGQPPTLRPPLTTGQPPAPRAPAPPGGTPAPSSLGAPGQPSAPMAPSPPVGTLAPSSLGAPGQPPAPRASAPPVGTPAPGSLGAPGQPPAPTAPAPPVGTPAPGSLGAPGQPPAPTAPAPPVGTPAPGSLGAPGQPPAPTAPAPPVGTPAPGSLGAPGQPPAPTAPAPPVGTPAPGSLGAPGQPPAPTAPASPGGTPAPQSIGAPGQPPAPRAPAPPGGTPASQSIGAPGQPPAPRAPAPPGGTPASQSIGAPGQPPAPRAPAPPEGTPTPSSLGALEQPPAPRAPAPPEGTPTPSSLGALEQPPAPRAPAPPGGTPAPQSIGALGHLPTLRPPLTTGQPPVPRAPAPPGETPAPWSLDAPGQPLPSRLPPIPDETTMLLGPPAPQEAPVSWAAPPFGPLPKLQVPVAPIGQPQMSWAPTATGQPQTSWAPIATEEPQMSWAPAESGQLQISWGSTAPGQPQMSWAPAVSGQPQTSWAPGQPQVSWTTTEPQQVFPTPVAAGQPQISEWPTTPGQFQASWDSRQPLPPVALAAPREPPIPVTLAAPGEPPTPVTFADPGEPPTPGALATPGLRPIPVGPAVPGQLPTPVALATPGLHPIPVGPAVPGQPPTSVVFAAPGLPLIPGVPAVPGQPPTSVVFAAPGLPLIPGAAAVPGQPPIPVTFAAPEEYPTSVTLAAPGEPPTPVTFATPGQPPTPVAFATPGLRPISVGPAVPGQPPTSVVFAAPGLPLIPGAPAVPGQPPIPVTLAAPGEPPTPVTFVAPGEPPTPVALATPGLRPIPVGSVVPGQPPTPVALATPGLRPIPVGSAVPGQPPTPAIFAAPGLPLIPRALAFPGQPPIPMVFAAPGQPLTPVAPVVPGQPPTPLVFPAPGQPPTLVAPAALGQPLTSWYPAAPEETHVPQFTPSPGQILVPPERQPLKPFVPDSSRQPLTTQPLSALEKLSTKLAPPTSLKPFLGPPPAPKYEVPQFPPTSEKPPTEWSPGILKSTQPYLPEEETGHKALSPQSSFIAEHSFPPVKFPKSPSPSAQFLQISQLMSSAQKYPKVCLPPIDNKLLKSSSFKVTEKAKMTVPPSSPGDFFVSAPPPEENRYFIDVKGQRKNLVILHRAVEDLQLPVILHQAAKELINETHYLNLIRLGYLFRKYIAYRMIQSARQNIASRIKAIRNSGRGYETQILYLFLNRIDAYKKKVMEAWTMKQRIVEQRRNICATKMIDLYGQIQKNYNIKFNYPVPLVIHRKEPDHPLKAVCFKHVVQWPLPDRREEKKEFEIFNKLEKPKDKEEAIWRADLSTSSFPIEPKIPIKVLWDQVGGYPDIPRLLELDICSAFSKSLASIQSRFRRIPH
ncbi:protein FAM186A [Notamacropus eugenii]|uniref:protein FAM186A n=1 Tax=Notamacropus eugenii TaxID=9315 RepID=UPI003B681AE6